MGREELLAAIEDRYGFRLPPTYRYAVGEGWTDPADWDRYTPLFMGEWLSPAAILEYDFQAVDPDTPANPGLIPFAQSPGGDPYCWCPARTVGGETVVGYTEYGEFDSVQLYAPGLLGFVYRNALEQLAAGCEYEDEAAAKHNLARWRATWFPLFPDRWRQMLAAVPDAARVEWARTLPNGYEERGRSFLHPAACRVALVRDLQFEGIDETVDVHWPGSGSAGR